MNRNFEKYLDLDQSEVTEKLIEMDSDKMEGQWPDRFDGKSLVTEDKQSKESWRIRLQVSKVNKDKVIEEFRRIFPWSLKRTYSIVFSLLLLIAILSSILLYLQNKRELRHIFPFSFFLFLEKSSVKYFFVVLIGLTILMILDYNIRPSCTFVLVHLLNPGHSNSPKHCMYIKNLVKSESEYFARCINSISTDPIKMILLDKIGNAFYKVLCSATKASEEDDSSTETSNNLPPGAPSSTTMSANQTHLSENKESIRFSLAKAIMEGLSPKLINSFGLSEGIHYSKLSYLTVQLVIFISIPKIVPLMFENAF